MSIHPTVEYRSELLRIRSFFETIRRARINIPPKDAPTCDFRDCCGRIDLQKVLKNIVRSLSAKAARPSAPLGPTPFQN